MTDASTPTVSVIIATYNWSNVLRHAIESVLLQTRRDFELLVVGDACTDDSGEIAASFGDPRIRWHNLPENCGNQYGPNNAGIAMARGRFIAYLGQDDIWLPDHLERHTDVMEKTGPDVTYSWLEMIGPEPVVMRHVTGINAGENYDGTTVLPPSALMHRREIVAEVGPWSDYRVIAAATDQEFIGRIFQAGKKFAAVRRLTALKFTAAWRPGCYIEKPAHQQAEALRQIRENPDFLGDELHLILEKFLRNHPDDVVKNPVPPPDALPGEFLEYSRRIRGASQDSQGASEVPGDFPPLREVLDLTTRDTNPYLGAGWSWPEPHFRWTNGREARVMFKMEEIKPLRVRVHTAPFLVAGKLDAQPVTITCNGKEAARWLLANHALETQEFTLDGNHLQTENTLVFQLPKAEMPLSFGYNGDSRHLALQVAWIEFATPDTSEKTPLAQETEPPLPIPPQGG